MIVGVACHCPGCPPAWSNEPAADDDHDGDDGYNDDDHSVQVPVLLHLLLLLSHPRLPLLLLQGVSSIIFSFYSWPGSRCYFSTFSSFSHHILILFITFSPYMYFIFSSCYMAYILFLSYSHIIYFKSYTSFHISYNSYCIYIIHGICEKYGQCIKSYCRTFVHSYHHQLQCWYKECGLSAGFKQKTPTSVSF